MKLSRLISFARTLLSDPISIENPSGWLLWEGSIAMKIEMILRGGRKEDFWDKALILEKFTDFTRADEDFEPICLRGKYWGLIKLDIIEMISGLKNQ